MSKEHISLAACISENSPHTNQKIKSNIKLYIEGCVLQSNTNSKKKKKKILETLK